MHILVTGASGFVGSRLIPRLRSDGHRVRALARDPARVDLAGMMTDSLQASSRAPASAPTLGAPTRGLAPRPASGARTSPGSPGSPGSAGEYENENVEVLTADVLTGEGLQRALHEVEVAYYLIHSMERSPTSSDDSKLASGRAIPFPERERIAAENFAAAATTAGVRRIVYLGGPTAGWSVAGEHAGEKTKANEPRAGERMASRVSRGRGQNKRKQASTHAREVTDEQLSPHLSSRQAVEHILGDAISDTIVLRASIVIGARSRSLRFLVRLVERMPVLALPAWHSYRTRPIDARDVTDMLAAAATLPGTSGSSLDVGGPEILSYGEMIQRIADLMLLSRPSFRVGVSATPLVAPLAAALVNEDPELVSALMESLQGDLLPGGPDGQSHLLAAQLLGVDLHSFDSAVERSLREWEAVEPLAAR